MDPNTALANARQAIDDHDNASSISMESDAAERLIEAFRALDEWLSKDGFLPTDWMAEEDKPEQAATTLCDGVGDPMANRRPHNDWVLGECPSCGKSVRNRSGITPQHTARNDTDRCTVEHGDWTGPHVRVSSCP